MNINQLHDKLVKKANMQKVAGPGAARLRKLIADFNRVRSNGKLVDSLKQTVIPSDSNLLEEALMPFIMPNKYLTTNNVLQKMKLADRYQNDTLNKLIDRIANNIESRRQKIRSLGGYDVEDAFDQKLINKYIKDITSK